MPSKETPFTPSSILFRPHPSLASRASLGWRRRVPPPGPMGLFRSSFIAIVAANDDRPYIVFCAGNVKGPQDGFDGFSERDLVRVDPQRALRMRGREAAGIIDRCGVGHH
jgi:hypothetical protein